MLKPGRFEPPLRRVLAVDAGSRCLRLLLLESRFGRLRVLKQEAMDLHEEGLVSPEEVRAHLQAALEDWGRPPVALALPQHVAVSQSVDLPPAPEDDSHKLIEAETVKLAGVSETAIVYDFVRVPSPDANRHRYWVTFCQEIEIQARITQLGLEAEDFREITTTANALLTAWRANHARGDNVVLVHAGAQSTTVAVAVGETGVFATSFPMGGDFFSRAIARSRNVPVESAEILKRRENLFEGAGRLAGLTEVVDGWAAELKRQLNDWREHHPRTGRGLAEFNVLASGGMFAQPGLLDYLKAHAGLKLDRWPADRGSRAALPAAGFEVALGTALQALGQSAQPVSLLPNDRRAAWKKRLGRQRLEFASSVLLAVVMCVLGFGLWQKTSLLRHKRALLAKVESGITLAQANQSLTAELLAGFDRLRPLFDRQQNTTDTLHTLDQLQRGRADRAFWYVLLGDQQTYFSHPAVVATTNKTAAFAEMARARSTVVTNTSPARPGCIAELCVPDDPEGARRTLSAVVSELKKSPVFARVDLLSEDLRRDLADPKVVLPGRHFALALDFATTEFQRPIQPQKGRAQMPTRPLLRPVSSSDAANPADSP